MVTFLCVDRQWFRGYGSVKCDYSLNIQQHQSGRWWLREETNGTDVWSCLSIRESNIQINTIRTFNYAMH